LKQGDALLPLLFNFALEYPITNDEENQDRLDLNRTQQQMVYLHNVNIQGGNINAIKKNTETLLEASREVGLEVNTEKRKYIVMSHYQNTKQK
jgi:hypothetical protein